MEREQVMSLISGVNYKTGELNVPFVELDSIAQSNLATVKAMKNSLNMMTSCER